jgi:hypothetical protein
VELAFDFANELKNGVSKGDILEIVSDKSSFKPTFNSNVLTAFVVKAMSLFLFF